MRVVTFTHDTGFTWPDLVEHVQPGLDLLTQHALLSSLMDAPEVDIMEVCLSPRGVSPSHSSLVHGRVWPRGHVVVCCVPLYFDTVLAVECSDCLVQQVSSTKLAVKDVYR